MHWESASDLELAFEFLHHVRNKTEPEEELTDEFYSRFECLDEGIEIIPMEKWVWYGWASPGFKYNLKTAVGIYLVSTVGEGTDKDGKEITFDCDGLYNYETDVLFQSKDQPGRVERSRKGRPSQLGTTPRGMSREDAYQNHIAMCRLAARMQNEVIDDDPLEEK